MALADPTARSVDTIDRLSMVRLALQIHSTWKDPEKMATILEKEIGEILDQLKAGEELHGETRRS